MATQVTPIFLYSMPRAGSTLMQRILGSHPAIASVSEPHVLLPFLGTYADVKIYDAAVSHDGIQIAFADVITQLPNGLQDYQSALRAFVSEIYGKLAGGKPYFLDKTPLYSVAAPQIVELFPEAKHIVLWRNPLAVVASLANTLESHAWVMSPYEVQLYSGMERIVEASKLPNVYSVKYEDVLTTPGETLSKLFAYLELSFSEELLSAFSQLKFERGDPTGVNDYDKLSQEPLSKWEATLCNPYRRAWARRYLEWLGRERLACMGYALDDLLVQLARTGTRPHTLAYDLTMNLYRRGQFLVWRNIDTGARATLKRLWGRA